MMPSLFGLKAILCHQSPKGGVFYRPVRLEPLISGDQTVRMLTLTRSDMEGLPGPKF